MYFKMLSIPAECITSCDTEDDEDSKAESSSSSVSHYPSEINLICSLDPQETFLTFIDVENDCAA